MDAVWITRRVAVDKVVDNLWTTRGTKRTGPQLAPTALPHVSGHPVPPHLNDLVRRAYAPVT